VLKLRDSVCTNLNLPIFESLLGTKDYEDICLILVQQLCALLTNCEYSIYERKGNMGDKVLVVDDELPVRDVLTDFLSGEGYEVILASNGEEALALAKKEDPQVILLDIGMPVINGLEVCKRLKADQHMKFIPVIIITGQAHSKEEAIEVGADDFINKPFDLIELSFRLKSALRMRYLTTEVQRLTARVKQLENNPRPL